MLQIAKDGYCRVQLTELYKMRTEPKKGAHQHGIMLEWRKFQLVQNVPRQMKKKNESGKDIGFQSKGQEMETLFRQL